VSKSGRWSARRETGTDVSLDADELDRCVKRIGGERIERGVLAWLGLRRQTNARYFLPELAFQRVRQYRRR
jgi:hypothetical protein